MSDVDRSQLHCIRAPRAPDRDAVLAVVRDSDLLDDAGVGEVAADLDAFFTATGDGRWLVTEVAGRLEAVAYFTPERLTDGTWNLLMLAVRPTSQRAGRGSTLVRAVEEDLHRRGARLLVIDTSGRPEFDGQRRFYARLGYAERARIPDFYAPGDDKVVFTRPVEAC